jgi:creatinine amidohydrolase
VHLDGASWPEVQPLASERLLVIPLGSTEQHGPHLSFTTDTDVAVALAGSLTARRDDVVVAPPLSYGASGEHAGFAGTLSIGCDAFERIVIELVRSADAFAGVVLVCGHGGNADPLASAVTTLQREGRRVLAWSPSMASGDAHAGRTETSLMLAVRPGGVRIERAEPGNTQPLEHLLPALRAGGVLPVSANGILGDPTGASASEGSNLLEALAADLAGAVGRWLE